MTVRKLEYVLQCYEVPCTYLVFTLVNFTESKLMNNREPETEFVPENGQSWQRVGCLLFQASRALALMRA